MPATSEPPAVPEIQTVVVTATAEPTPVVVTSTAEATPVVVTVVVVATNTPAPPAEASATPTETPLPPTETPRPRPRPAPTSAGPLDFSEPTELDHWQRLADDEYECRITVRITGGAPPYIVSHDLDDFSTWETDFDVVFKARGCSGLVHTIAVESADGQSVSHDYYISPPWCK